MSDNRLTYYHNTSAGLMEIVADGSFLYSVKFIVEQVHPQSDSDSLIKECISQIDEYFSGKRTEFNLPLFVSGTPFQEKIWNIIRDIAYGETVTYSELASMADCPGGQRAAANACNKNCFHIIIPCHRVIGSSGKLTGYAAGLKIKKSLLELEKRD